MEFLCCEKSPSSLFGPSCDFLLLFSCKNMNFYEHFLLRLKELADSEMGAGLCKLQRSHVINHRCWTGAPPTFACGRLQLLDELGMLLHLSCILLHLLAQHLDLIITLLDGLWGIRRFTQKIKKRENL